MKKMLDVIMKVILLMKRCLASALCCQYTFSQFSPQSSNIIIIPHLIPHQILPSSVFKLYKNI